MKHLWVPDRRTQERLASMAKRMGIDLRPLPSLEERRQMLGREMDSVLNAGHRIHAVDRGAGLVLVADPTLPRDYFEVGTGTRRVGFWLSDPDGSLARWADDGGRA